MGTRQRIEITPNMVALFSAIGGAIMIYLGHPWIGGMLLVCAFFLWWFANL